ncbi:S8 family serine peptidase [Flagellimonas allohymeniacidonis]|nr:S8 family serine peptidase [Allomuricauda hymeniacidonis]
MKKLLAGKGWKQVEKTSDGTFVELNDVGDDGTPLFYATLNSPSSEVSRANSLYTNGALELGLNGTGMQVGVWDAGTALESHQEFDVRAFNGDQSESVSSHATLVTGTIISSGMKPKAKGVAFGAEAFTHDWTRDKIEVAQAAAAGLLLSNHSYGIKSDRVPDWYFGAYIRVSQDWDKIMYNAPYYLMVSAAGNAQKSFDNEAPIFGKTADGFDLLLGFTTSKNALTIAGANTKIDNRGELKEASVTTYSSLGPVDDGRIKPDLAGDGSTVLSTSSKSNSSYETSVGTSMAAPGVTGSLLLLQQYHSELFGNYMKAATLKGLVLHTADDVGSKGPDYKMGWGVINTKRAAEVLQDKDYRTYMEETRLSQGDTLIYEFKASGDLPLMASISWTDPEGEYVNRGELNSTTRALVNDLDIRIFKDGTAYLPWKLNPNRANDAATKGDNLVDPYERIEIENAKGNYTIVITHKGQLKNGIQDVALAVSGVQVSNCSTEVPDRIELTSFDEESAMLGWAESEDTLFEVQYKASGAASWEIEYVYENNLTLEELEMDTEYQVRIRSICTENKVSDFSDEYQFWFNGRDTEVIGYETFSFDEPLEISVYPNPATNYITVDAALSNDAVYSVVTSSGFVAKQGSATEKINVADLASGLYILVVQDYAGIKSSKFYKN